MIWLLIWVVFPTLALGAQLETSLIPNTAHIGDTLQLRIRVKGAEGTPIRFIPPDNEDFVVLRVDSSNIGAANEISFILALYDLGQFTLPQLPVLVGSAPAETLWTPLLSATISPLLPDSAQSPLPLKPYRSHPFQWRELLAWWWILALAVIAGIAYWLWHRYSRKSTGAPGAPKIPLLPPHDEAVRSLILLRDKKYPARGMLKEFFTEYSHVMRRYLERRFEFPALEMTTFDLENELGDGNYPASLAERLLPVLREADLVKFAKHVPDFQRCDGCIDLGFELVELTRSRPENTQEALAA
ncbi:hypothetical protein KKH27_12185 [bacterium]|nr:hypothetical protein [bacterium]MBU1983929.1 hypothetical protein [bacterium]